MTIIILMKRNSDVISVKKGEEVNSNTFELLKGWIREDKRIVSPPPPRSGVNHEEIKEIN